jgi:hypothetical protein
MAPFMVYRNPNPQTRKVTPYLLDVHNDLLSELRTRVAGRRSAQSGRCRQP